MGCSYQGTPLQKALAAPGDVLKGNGRTRVKRCPQAQPWVVFASAQCKGDVAGGGLQKATSFRGKHMVCELQCGSWLLPSPLPPLSAFV